MPRKRSLVHQLTRLIVLDSKKTQDSGFARLHVVLGQRHPQDPDKPGMYVGLRSRVAVGGAAKE